MYEDWLEKIYAYDQRKVDSTLDELLDKVHGIMEQDTGYDILTQVFEGASAIGMGRDPKFPWEGKQSSNYDTLLREIDCERCDSQMMTAFVAAVQPLSGASTEYANFVERVKVAHGARPRFDSLFRGFRGFKQWSEK